MTESRKPVVEKKNLHNTVKYLTDGSGLFFGISVFQNDFSDVDNQKANPINLSKTMK
jgi:hypothetical protein